MEAGDKGTAVQLGIVITFHHVARQHVHVSLLRETEITISHENLNGTF